MYIYIINIYRYVCVCIYIYIYLFIKKLKTPCFSSLQPRWTPAAVGCSPTSTGWTGTARTPLASPKGTSCSRWGHMTHDVHLPSTVTRQRHTHTHTPRALFTDAHLSVDGAVIAQYKEAFELLQLLLFLGIVAGASDLDSRVVVFVFWQWELVCAHF